MALPKKYFKMFPGNLKKAWAKYNADKKSRSGGSTSKKKNKTSTKKGAPVSKKKYKQAAKKVATKIKYRTKELKPIELLIRSLIATAGGATSSLIVNKTPFVKGLNPLLKSGAQMAVGFSSLYFIPKKWAALKFLGVGSFTAGTFGLFQKLTKLEVLAGEAELTDEEIQALLSAGYLSGPTEMGALSGPADLGRSINPAFMGAGEKPSMMGSDFEID